MHVSQISQEKEIPPSSTLVWSISGWSSSSEWWQGVDHSRGLLPLWQSSSNISSSVTNTEWPTTSHCFSVHIMGSNLSVGWQTRSKSGSKFFVFQWNLCVHPAVHLSSRTKVSDGLTDELIFIFYSFFLQKMFNFHVIQAFIAHYRSLLSGKWTLRPFYYQIFKHFYIFTRVFLNILLLLCCQAINKAKTSLLEGPAPCSLQYHKNYKILYRCSSNNMPKITNTLNMNSQLVFWDLFYSLSFVFNGSIFDRNSLSESPETFIGSRVYYCKRKSLSLYGFKFHLLT